MHYILVISAPNIQRSSPDSLVSSLTQDGFRQIGSTRLDRKRIYANPSSNPNAKAQ